MFAIETWGGASKTTINKLDNLQVQASKLATGNLNPRDSDYTRQMKLGWPTVSQQIAKSTHLLTWKILNLGIPEDTASRMPRNTTGHRIQSQIKLAQKPKWLNTTKLIRSSYRGRAYSYNTHSLEVSQARQHYTSLSNH